MILIVEIIILTITIIIRLPRGAAGTASGGALRARRCERVNVLYYTILYDTIRYYTILHYTRLYYTILYYIILYYTILYDVM